MGSPIMLPGALTGLAQMLQGQFGPTQGGAPAAGGVIPMPGPAPAGGQIPGGPIAFPQPPQGGGMPPNGGWAPQMMPPPGAPPVKPPQGGGMPPNGGFMPPPQGGGMPPGGGFVPPPRQPQTGPAQATMQQGPSNREQRWREQQRANRLGGGQ